MTHHRPGDAVDRPARAAGGLRPGRQPDRRGEDARHGPPGGRLAPGVLLLGRAARARRRGRSRSCSSTGRRAKTSGRSGSTPRRPGTSASGRAWQEAAREVREELGIQVELSDMVALGRHRQQHHHANGLIDREHHALHLLTPGPPDAAYAAGPAARWPGSAWIDADDLLGLVEGQLGEATARYRAVDAPPDAFVERTLDGRPTWCRTRTATTAG